MLVEILFIASAFQCGADAVQAEFQLHVTGGETLLVGDKTYVHVESLEDLQFGYSVLSDGDCAIENVPGIAVEYDTVLPTNVGAFEQPSLLDIIAEHVTEPYLSLVLWEVGTTDAGSSAYDLQDLVVKLNTNPTIYAD